MRIFFSYICTRNFTYSITAISNFLKYMYIGLLLLAQHLFTTVAYGQKNVWHQYISDC